VARRTQDAAAVKRVEEWVGAHPRAADAILAVLIAVVCMPMAVLMARAAPTPRVVLLIGTSIVVHVAIAFRRTLPFASFALVSACLAVQVLVPASAMPTGAVFMPCAVLFPLALGTYCSYGRWPARPLALVVGIAGAIMITVRGALVSPLNVPGLPEPVVWAFFFGFMLAVVFAPWSYSALRQTRLAYVEALEERARRAESEREERARHAVLDERTRIARDMHDVVAHSLAVIVTQAQGGQYAPERAPAVLETIAETGRQALADMRGLLGVLRTDAGPADGFGPQPTLADVPDLLDRVRATGLDVNHRESGTPRPVGRAVELAGFRLVQEALTNTMKHAGTGARAEVHAAWEPDALTVTVVDDGRGGGVSGGGHGLIGMRERITVVGGTLSAAPRASGGFEVRAVLPYTSEVPQ
jgi:signal transduction histidine kinase